MSNNYKLWRGNEKNKIQTKTIIIKRLLTMYKNNSGLIAKEKERK